MGKSASHGELHSRESYLSPSRSAHHVAMMTGGTGGRGATIADSAVRQAQVDRMGRLVRRSLVPTATCSHDREIAVDGR